MVSRGHLPCPTFDPSERPGVPSERPSVAFCSFSMADLANTTIKCKKQFMSIVFCTSGVIKQGQHAAGSPQSDNLIKVVSFAMTNVMNVSGFYLNLQDKE